MLYITNFYITLLGGGGVGYVPLSAGGNDRELPRHRCTCTYLTVCMLGGGANYLPVCMLGGGANYLPVCMLGGRATCLPVCMLGGGAGGSRPRAAATSH